MIGIILPRYGRNEATAAALRLAELATLHGLEVRLITLAPREDNIQPGWDTRVISASGHGIRRALVDCEAVIHFGFSPVVADAKLAAHTAMHILVMSWHAHWIKMSSFKPYDIVVCPSAVFHTAFTGVLRLRDAAKMSWESRSLLEKLVACRWVADLARVPRHCLASDTALRACFYCDNVAIRRSSKLILDAIDSLLTAIASLRITLLLTKSWPSYARKRLNVLTKKWLHRLVWKRTGNLISQAVEFGAHDWVVIPSVRADFGIHAARALALGTPVIAYDVPPFNEVVRDRQTGRLVPCEISRWRLAAPMAVENSTPFLSVCSEVLMDAQQLFALHDREWNLGVERQAFDRFWLRLWR